MRGLGKSVSDIRNISVEELNSMKGYRFEKWVIKNTSIQIASYYGKECRVKMGGDWIVREWRSDKSVPYSKNGTKIAMPISSLAPDLMLEATKDLYGKGGWRKGDVIFVECKWRSSGYFSLEERKIKNYEFALKRHFTKRKKKPLEHLFYVFGFGWDKDRGNPISAFCVPATKLYYELFSGRRKTKYEFGIKQLELWGVPLIDEDNITYIRYKEK